MEDCYGKLINIIKKHGSAYNPPSIDLGVVLNLDPLIIKIGDLQLTKDNLLVADYLLKNYKRKITIPSTSATGSTTTGSITTIGISDADLNFTDSLKKEDILACLATEDRQTYIILCRVVKA
ncbi:DUF2577 domain-containing protein [Clostridium aciditolerans]|uniref:DUF2577 domain-containing protein n=1 Tax=Clostridium aciditolerans TaxID=339861 RepID=A0A934HSX7_9CLOT|nr:DUF2577 domain-containing protein [Clostridium aciditolerans]MBI6873740.1 DUF2577 domain-containing protein [Clostridium aciditolerans]